MKEHYVCTIKMAIANSKRTIEKHMKIKHVKKTITTDKKIFPTDIINLSETSQKKDFLGLVKTLLTNTKLK